MDRFQITAKRGEGRTTKYASLLKWAVVLVIMALIGGMVPTGHVIGAQGNTWYVATDGSNVTGDGSEASPFATIQHAIDVTSHGDTVLVNPGTYIENINFNGKNIVVGSLFMTTNDENYISQTVIDGNHSGRVVTFENGENSTAMLSGFTITNGYAQGANPARNGGGIACYSSHPTLANLNVVGNSATNEGGGVYFSWSNSRLRDATIANNMAQGGGGIRYSYGSPSIENVIVSGNSASASGGGMFFYHANASVKNVLIANNVAHDVLNGDGGGGLYFDGCSPSFVNVTVVGNSTSGHGGGLHVSYASHPSLVNSIVWGNSPQQIYFDTEWGGEAITIEYSDIQGGETGIVTNGQGPAYWLEGNLDSDPLFIGNGDYHLSDNSPCIGGGMLLNAPNTDIEGNSRPDPADSNPDMGAYENPLGTPILNTPPTADAGGPYTVGEGGLVLVTASGSDPDGDPLTFAWDFDNDGAYESPGQSVSFSAVGLDGPSSHPIAVQITDSGGLSANHQTTVEVLNVAPTVGRISAPADAVAVNTEVNASADFTDPGVLDTHTALWDWDDGSTSAGTVYETNGSGFVTGKHAYTTPDVYAVTLTVKDKDGDSAESTLQFIVVYDPEAASVTGGGWIESPPEVCSYEADAKASFGFASMYKKGANVPTGETEFRHKACGLNFHSSGYDWLMVAGAKAIVKGKGTVNGTGSYGFTLTAVDAGIDGNDSFDTDRFRIRIWDTMGTEDEADDVVVFDNQVCEETGNDADPCTEISGGNIVIHK